jgi:hypothetical protein
MADWKKLAKATLLADGRIDAREVEILRREIFADHVDEEELEFLADLRHLAPTCVRAFTELFFKAVKEYVLHDGVIDDAEALWLRDTLFADNRIDPDEVALLRDLKAAATRTGPEFDKLYLDCVK